MFVDGGRKRFQLFAAYILVMVSKSHDHDCMYTLGNVAYERVRL